MSDKVRYISGLPYINTVDDVVETIECLVNDSGQKFTNREDFISDLQGVDSGLSLYEAYLLYRD